MTDMDAALIAQAPTLLAYAEKSLRFLVAERDCYYDHCSTASGHVPDIEDQMCLNQFDQEIAALRGLIARAKGGA